MPLLSKNVHYSKVTFQYATGKAVGDVWIQFQGNLDLPVLGKWGCSYAQIDGIAIHRDEPGVGVGDAVERIDAQATAKVPLGNFAPFQIDERQ